MKKPLRIIALVLALCLALGLGAFAADRYTKELIANYVGVQLVVNGENVIPKDAKGNIVEPFIVDGTTYLPVRAVAEALGQKVEWDGTTKTVYIGEKQSSPSPSISPVPSPIQGETLSQKNAVAKAKEYLRIMAFSRDGLIRQLEFEKFEHEDAVYGADNCGADWFEQADKKGKAYLESAAFSYEGLISQLKFEGFTYEQAAYGVDNCGADWFEQAAKKAEEYLNFMSFSREGLIAQLEFEKFTHEQAVYGADSVGY